MTVPLVRGYVFVEGGVDWAAVQKVRGVIRPLRSYDHNVAVITQEQIDRMRSVCMDLHDAVSRPQFMNGDRVRVRKGAFAEIDAVITAATKGGHTIEYTMLGKTFRQTLPVDQMEAA